MLPSRCSWPSGRTTADPVSLGSGRVNPLVSPCPKAPRAMAIIAKCVDAQPGHVAGRLLPNGSGILLPQPDCGPGNNQQGANQSASAGSLGEGGNDDESQEVREEDPGGRTRYGNHAGPGGKRSASDQ